MAAVIQISTGGAPVTGSVIAAAATLCTLSNVSNTGVAGWFWELVDKPAGSVATLSSATNSSTQITVDIPGTYMVRLTTYADAARTIFDASDLEAIGVRYTSPYTWRLPSAYETTQFSNTVGWKGELNSILAEIRSGLLSGPLLSISMTDAVTAAAQLGTPVFVRSGGNNTWDPPVSPVPTLTAGIAVPSYPTDTGLRLTLPTTTAPGGNISGTWMYPLTGLASIPTNGVAIEVDIANQDSGVLFFVAPIARFSGGSMASGMVMQHESAFSGITSYQVYRETGEPFPRIAGASSVLTYQFPTTPNFLRAINKVRYEVKADGPQTPARWRISAFASTTAGLGINQTNAGGASGAANPIDNGVGPPVPIPRYWDGLARPTLGIGIGRSGAALNGSVLLTGIRIYAL